MATVVIAQRTYQMTEKQVKAFLKHDGMMSANVYDMFYEKVRDKAKELKKKEEAPAEPTTKKCPFCQTEIDIKATRCPHCTSELKE